MPDVLRGRVVLGCSIGSFTLALSTLIALLKKLSNSGKGEEDTVVRGLMLLETRLKTCTLSILLLLSEKVSML